MRIDLQEKRKLDSERLAGQLAQVKARTRPWRSIIALVVAIVAAAVNYEQRLSSLHVPGHDTARPVTVITAVVFCVFAAGAIVGLSGTTRAALQSRWDRRTPLWSAIRSCCCPGRSTSAS